MALGWICITVHYGMWSFNASKASAKRSGYRPTPFTFGWVVPFVSCHRRHAVLNELWDMVGDMPTTAYD